MPIKQFIIIAVCFLSLGLHAQFYNGMQTDFGKNRVQYRPYLWQYYRLPSFDVYFYENGSNLASYVAKQASLFIPEMEAMVGTTLQNRIIFLVYNNLSDFRQSNIGLITGNDQYNIGGTTQLIDNKVSLYYEGDHRLLDKQIKAAIAEILINQALFGSDFKAKLTNSTLLSLPDWYFKGLISYLSEEWNSDIENNIRDGVMNHRFDKFNRLSGKDAIYAGHAIWFFITQKFGKQTIPNILYLTRISKNVETGFLYTIGLPVKYLSHEWLDFFQQKFEKDESTRISPNETFATKKIKNNRIVRELRLSPDEQWTAYSVNYMGRIKVYLKNNNSGKNFSIYKQGVRLDQITDYSYPIIAWHPTGKLVAFIVEKKGTKYLYTYEIETKELSFKELFNVEKILDFSFSHNGFNLVLSAVKNGKTDIFVFNNAANSYEQITNDLADDRYPQFIDLSSKIVFSSNRLSNILPSDSMQYNYDIFVYDYKNKSNELTRITESPYADDIKPNYYAKNEFLLLSNPGGLYNKFIAKYDSTISYIDTTTHYRYFTESKPLTNYSRNILDHSYSNTLKSSDLFYFKGLNFSQINNIETTDLQLPNESPFFKNMKKYKLDSIRKETQVKKILDTLKPTFQIDTNHLDINNYIFNFQLNQLKGHVKQENEKTSNEKTVDLKPMVYLTSFYTNSLTTQVDFGFLNNSYQPFTGGPFYFNPGFNVFFKLGTNDLFEDYKITGGVRFAGNFNSNEYLLSFENLKNRLDKQIVFHRLALNKLNNTSLLKTHTHEMYYIIRYPFNQVSAFRLTSQFRYDRLLIFHRIQKPFSNPTTSA
jgi:WD40 repeat protein